jgi:hypothetical protein
MSAGHGELEARLQVDAREQYRLLLQGHLDERAAREPRRSRVTGSDEVPRRRVENGHSRGLVSVFGSVTVTRKAYRAAPAAPAGPAGAQAGGAGKTAGNLYPADAVLNLPVGKHSAGLTRLAATEAVRGSFEDAQEAIERVTGVRVGKRQVEELAAVAAVDVDAFYAARRPAPCPDRVLMLQADGKGITMRPDGLRPATAAQDPARQLNAEHWSRTGRPASAETLRIQLRVGAATARALKDHVRHDTASDSRPGSAAAPLLTG